MSCCAAPRTWCYHPSPDNLIQLIKTQFRNGLGVCFVDVFRPHLNIDVHPKGIIYCAAKQSKPKRMRRFVFSFFHGVFHRKSLLLSAKLVYAVGYIYGLCKYRILRSTS